MANDDVQTGRPPLFRLRAFTRRVQPVPPTPEPTPELLAVPFDGRDFRTLSRLLNARRAADGSAPLTQRQWAGLRAAAEEKRLSFFLALLHGEAVGLCAVCPVYSVEQCAPGGMVEALYILPGTPQPEQAEQVLVQCACEALRAQGGTFAAVAGAGAGAARLQALGFCQPCPEGLLRPLENTP